MCVLLREGQFGACFLSHSGNSFIYCSRPGLRLWQTDMSGVVMQTIQLKDTLPDALASCIDLKYVFTLYIYFCNS